MVCPSTFPWFCTRNRTAKPDRLVAKVWNHLAPAGDANIGPCGRIPSPAKHPKYSVFWALRVLHRGLFKIAFRIPVVHPFHHIARPIHDSVGALIGLKRADNRGDLVAILHPSPIRSVGLFHITPGPQTSIRS